MLANDTAEPRPRVAAPSTQRREVFAWAGGGSGPDEKITRILLAGGCLQLALELITKLGAQPHGNDLGRQFAHQSQEGRQRNNAV